MFARGSVVLLVMAAACAKGGQASSAPPDLEPHVAAGTERACAEPIRFQSPALEQAVRDQTGAAEGPLRAADVAEIRTLWSKDLAVESLEGIGCLANLESLRIQSEQPVDLTPLTSLPRLRRLHLDEAVVNDAGPLGTLPSLRRLRLRVEANTQLAGLERAETLDSLRLWITGAADLAPVAGLPDLRRLDLTVLGATDLAPLSRMQTLRRIEIHLSHPTDLAAVADLHQLRRLTIVARSADFAVVVPNVRQLKKLKRLNLTLDQPAVDLSTLDGLDGLKRLVLRLESTKTLELGFVEKLRKLKAVSIHSVAEVDIKALEQARPKVRFTLTRPADK